MKDKFAQVCRKHAVVLSIHGDDLVCPKGHVCNHDFIVVDRKTGLVVNAVPEDETESERTRTEKEDKRMRSGTDDTKPGVKKQARFEGNGERLTLKLLRRKAAGPQATVIDADPYAVAWETRLDKRTTRGTIGFFPILSEAERSFDATIAGLAKGWVRSAAMGGKTKILPVPAPGEMAKKAAKSKR
jgi:hypothetical protein